MHYLSLLSVLMILFGCKQIDGAPKIELCVVQKKGDVGCSDPRLKEDEQSYFRYLRVGDILTNPDDFQLLINDYLETKRELAKCEIQK